MNFTRRLFGLSVAATAALGSTLAFAQAGQTVKIAWIPEDRPGKWMYHCHILEHHEAGMMGHFDVVR